MRDFANDDPNSGGIEGNLELLLHSDLRTERKKKRFRTSDEFISSNINDFDMSDIDYYRVNLGVDFPDEIIDNDISVTWDDDCPYAIDSSEAMVDEEVLNVTEWFNETIQHAFHSIKLP